MLGIRERVKPLSSPERGGASRDGKARAATPAPAGAAPGISDTRVTTSRAWPQAGGPSVENDSTSDIIDSSVPLEVVAVVTVVLSLKSVRGV